MKILLSIVIMFCGLFNAVNSAFAQTWTLTGAPSRNWETVVSSADGSKLIAGSLFWIYGISTNGGTTWITNTEPQAGSAYGGWFSIASSADGTKYAAALANVIWVSTNSGSTWLSNNVTGNFFFSSLAMSADGNKLVAVVGDNSSPGPIYTSTNSGITLTLTPAPTNNWMSVASSADGSKLVAVVSSINGTTNGNVIYISTNSGSSWILTSAPTNIPWSSVASSVDGSKFVAASDDAYVPGSGFIYGSVYTSTNSGMNWTSNNIPKAQWQSVASSADGTKLVAIAVEPNGLIYSSTNSGSIWVSNNAPNYSWQFVASSADGNKFMAAAVGDQSLHPVPIYGLQSTPTTQLN